MRQVVDRELRRFVVRLQDPVTGQTWGSGVLVAPGWVLTCAHVVRDAEKVTVAVDPRAAANGGTPPAMVTGTVRARSDSPSTESRSAFWPYPDLAVVQLDGWSANVCAPLLFGEPSQDSEPHAWGFGRREESVAAVGGPASFSYVGQDADGFLQLQAGEAPPGLSGAPLICPTRRGVVGLMSVARSATAPRGGWASPVTALREPGTGGTPAQLGQLLIEQNIVAAQRDRDAWAATIRIGGALDTVDRFWVGAVVDPETGQPSTMLRAEFGVVPYLPRGNELDRLDSWCAAPASVSVAYIEAAGGAGKTRFAIEACQRLERRGWIAGFLPAEDRGAATLDAPRLLVVDYVDEHDAPQLGKQLAEMTRTATPLTPARLLLLSRPAVNSPVGHAVDLLKEDVSGVALSALDETRDMSDTVAGLSFEQKQTLYNAAVISFGHTWFGDDWSPAEQGSPPADLSSYERPLDVLFDAFDAVLMVSDDMAEERRPPIDRALDHEQRHWRRRFPDLMDVLPLAVALATLCGAHDQTDADALLDLIPEVHDRYLRDRLDAAVQLLYTGPDLWNPLHPDRLGESLVSRQLRINPALVDSVLHMSSDSQVSRALTVLVRLADDADVRALVISALLSSQDQLSERCTQHPPLPDGHRARIQLLDALARADTALLQPEAMLLLPAKIQRSLSVSLDRLGILLGHYGRVREARVLLSLALAIDTRAATVHPDNPSHQRSVGLAHQRLGDLDRDAGRPADAAAHFHHYLTAAEALTTLDPDNPSYQQDLALAHQRLGDLDRNAGRPADAAAHFHHYLTAAEALTTLDPDNPGHQRDLAAAQQRLGDLDRDAGRTADAAAHYLHSLTAAEALTTLDPDNPSYQQDLALAHQRLGDLDRNAGRPADAAAHYRHYLTAAEALTTLDPDNPSYQQDLGLAHLRLGDLDRDADRTADAAAHYRHYLRTAEALTTLDPDNPRYQRDLAAAHQRLGDLDRDARRTADAAAHYRPYLSTAEALTALDPDNPTYRQDLGLAHQRLGDLDRDADRTADAAAHYRHYLRTAEALITLDPDNPTYRQDLGLAHQRLGDLDRNAGRPTDAATHYRHYLTAAEALTALDPDNPSYQRNLGLAHLRLGDLDRDAGRPADAAAHHRHYLSTAETLTALDTDNPTYRQDLVQARLRLGDLDQDVDADR